MGWVDWLTRPVSTIPQADGNSPRFDPGQDFGGPFPEISSEIGTESYRDVVLNVFEVHYLVFSCVATHAVSAATLPLKSYTRAADGISREEVRGSKAQRLLRTPNTYMDGIEILEAKVHDDWIAGESFWELTPNVAGTEIVELHPLRPDHMDPIVDEREGLVGWAYRVGNRTIRYSTDEIIHWKFQRNPLNRFRGLSPIVAARLSLQTDLAAARYNANFFQNGAIPGGLLETEQDLLRSERKEIRKDWERFHRGPKRAGRTAVLDKGLRYNGAALSQRDAQWMQSRQFTQEEVLAICRTPAPVLGITRGVNYSNADAMIRLWYQNSVRPGLRKTERKLTDQLLAPHFDEDEFVEFLMDEIMRPEFGARIEALSKAWWFTPNEKRRQDNLPSVEDGDQLYHPVNLSTGGHPVEEDVASRIQEEGKAGRFVRKLLGRETRDLPGPGPSALAQKLLEEMVERSVGPRILEVGCDEGNDLLLFAKAGLDVSAVDVSPGKVEAARHALDRQELAAWVEVAPARDLPFLEGSFDAVFSLGALQDEDLETGLAEVARVLRRDGLCLLQMYLSTQAVDGNTTVFGTADAVLQRVQGYDLEILEIVTDQEDEYDTYGERHKMLSCLCRKRN